MAKIKKIKDRSNSYQNVGQYDYDGLAHWWAYNSGSKSTANDRMSCSNEYCYSYRTVIAKMLDGRDKANYNPTVLVTDDTYSPTTTKHIGSVLNAVGHMNVIRVHNPNPKSKDDHNRNLEHMMEKMKEAAERYQRCRVDNTRQAQYYIYERTRAYAVEYAHQFRLKSNRVFKNIMKLGKIGDENTLEDILAIERREEKRLARKEQKEILKRIEENKEKSIKAHADLILWKSGKSDNIPSMGYIENQDIQLRIKGNVIETTSRASISLKAAFKAYKKYVKGTLKIGDSISGFKFYGVSDGIATIGCHKIKLKIIHKLFDGYKEQAGEPAENVNDDVKGDA